MGKRKQPPRGVGAAAFRPAPAGASRTARAALLALAVALAAALAVAPRACGGTTLTMTQNGSWGDPALWTPQQAPVTGDDIVVSCDIGACVVTSVSGTYNSLTFSYPGAAVTLQGAPGLGLTATQFVVSADTTVTFAFDSAGSVSLAKCGALVSGSLTLSANSVALCSNTPTTTVGYRRLSVNAQALGSGGGVQIGGLGQITADSAWTLGAPAGQSVTLSGGSSMALQCNVTLTSSGSGSARSVSLSPSPLWTGGVAQRLTFDGGSGVTWSVSGLQWNASATVAATVVLSGSNTFVDFPSGSTWNMTSAALLRVASLARVVTHAGMRVAHASGSALALATGGTWLSTSAADMALFSASAALLTVESGQTGTLVLGAAQTYVLRAAALSFGGGGSTLQVDAPVAFAATAALSVSGSFSLRDSARIWSLRPNIVFQSDLTMSAPTSQLTAPTPLAAPGYGVGSVTFMGPTAFGAFVWTAGASCTVAGATTFGPSAEWTTAAATPPVVCGGAGAVNVPGSASARVSGALGVPTTGTVSVGAFSALYVNTTSPLTFGQLTLTSAAVLWVGRGAAVAVSAYNPSAGDAQIRIERDAAVRVVATSAAFVGSIVSLASTPGTNATVLFGDGSGTPLTYASPGSLTLATLNGAMGAAAYGNLVVDGDFVVASGATLFTAGNVVFGSSGSTGIQTNARGVIDPNGSGLGPTLLRGVLAAHAGVLTLTSGSTIAGGSATVFTLTGGTIGVGSGGVLGGAAGDAPFIAGTAVDGGVVFFGGSTLRQVNVTFTGPVMGPFGSDVLLVDLLGAGGDVLLPRLTFNGTVQVSPRAGAQRFELAACEMRRPDGSGATIVSYGGNVVLNSQCAMQGVLTGAGAGGGTFTLSGGAVYGLLRVVSPAAPVQLSVLNAQPDSNSELRVGTGVTTVDPFAPLTYNAGGFVRLSGCTVTTSMSQFLQVYGPTAGNVTRLQAPVSVGSFHNWAGTVELAGTGIIEIISDSVWHGATVRTVTAGAELRGYVTFAAGSTGTTLFENIVVSASLTLQSPAAPAGVLGRGTYIVAGSGSYIALNSLKVGNATLACVGFSSGVTLGGSGTVTGWAGELTRIGSLNYPQSFGAVNGGATLQGAATTIFGPGFQEFAIQNGANIVGPFTFPSTGGTIYHGPVAGDNPVNITGGLVVLPNMDWAGTVVLRDAGALSVGAIGASTGALVLSGSGNATIGAGALTGGNVTITAGSTGAFTAVGVAFQNATVCGATGACVFLTGPFTAAGLFRCANGTFVASGATQGVVTGLSGGAGASGRAQLQLSVTVSSAFAVSGVVTVAPPSAVALPVGSTFRADNGAVIDGGAAGGRGTVFTGVGVVQFGANAVLRNSPDFSAVTGSILVLGSSTAYADASADASGNALDLYLPSLLQSDAIGASAFVMDGATTPLRSVTLGATLQPNYGAALVARGHNLTVTVLTGQLYVATADTPAGAGPGPGPLWVMVGNGVTWPGMVITGTPSRLNVTAHPAVAGSTRVLGIGGNGALLSAVRVLRGSGFGAYRGLMDLTAGTYLERDVQFVATTDFVVNGPASAADYVTLQPPLTVPYYRFSAGATYVADSTDAAGAAAGVVFSPPAYLDTAAAALGVPALLRAAPRDYTNASASSGLALGALSGGVSGTIRLRGSRTLALTDVRIGAGELWLSADDDGSACAVTTEPGTGVVIPTGSTLRVGNVTALTLAGTFLVTGGGTLYAAAVDSVDSLTVDGLTTVASGSTLRLRNTLTLHRAVLATNLTYLSGGAPGIVADGVLYLRAPIAGALPPFDFTGTFVGVFGAGDVAVQRLNIASLPPAVVPVAVLNSSASLSGTVFSSMYCALALDGVRVSAGKTLNVTAPAAAGADDTRSANVTLGGSALVPAQAPFSVNGTLVLTRGVTLIGAGVSGGGSGTLWLAGCNVTRAGHTTRLTTISAVRGPDTGQTVYVEAPINLSGTVVWSAWRGTVVLYGAAGANVVLSAAPAASSDPIAPPAALWFAFAATGFGSAAAPVQHSGVLALDPGAKLALSPAVGATAATQLALGPNATLLWSAQHADGLGGGGRPYELVAGSVLLSAGARMAVDDTFAAVGAGPRVRLALQSALSVDFAYNSGWPTLLSSVSVVSAAPMAFSASASSAGVLLLDAGATLSSAAATGAVWTFAQPNTRVRIGSADNQRETLNFTSPAAAWSIGGAGASSAVVRIETCLQLPYSAPDLDARFQVAPPTNCSASDSFFSCAADPCVAVGDYPAAHTVNCTSLQRNPQCLCHAGFQGAVCQTDINECASQPCVNGGTCADQINGFNCTCTAAFTGAICSVDVNECLTNNGGCGAPSTCFNSYGSWDCTPYILPGNTVTSAEATPDAVDPTRYRWADLNAGKHLDLNIASLKRDVGQFNVTVGPTFAPLRFPCGAAAFSGPTADRFDLHVQCVLGPVAGAALYAWLSVNDTVYSQSAYSFAVPPPSIASGTLRRVETGYDNSPTAHLYLDTVLPTPLAFAGANFFPADARLMNVSFGPGYDPLRYACAILSPHPNTTATSIQCTTDPRAAGINNVFTITVAGQSSNTGSDLLDFPVVPGVFAVTGCPLAINGTATGDCPTSGRTNPQDNSTVVRLTVTGENFDAAATVTVGAAECARVSITSDAQLTCDLPVGLGRKLLVAVTGGNGRKSRPQSVAYVSYKAPSISALIGCYPDAVAGASGAVRNCTRAGNDLITILGDNFGRLNAQVLVGSALCADAAHDPVMPHQKLTCSSPSGTRLRVPVVVLQSGAISSGAPAALSYVQCVPGTYADALVCRPCASGYVSETPEAQECVPCLSGTFSGRAPSSACTPCPAGTFSSNGASACTECVSGTASAGQGRNTCPPCAQGTFSAANRSTECARCDAGSVQPALSATTCVVCPAGKAQGAQGQSQCVACAKGTYSARDGAHTCVACDVGTYQPNPQQTACLACPLGSAASGTGQEQCAVCDAGTAGRPDGTCQACPAGRYQNGRGTVDCAPCDAGTSSPVRSASCRACDEGFQAPYPGANCTGCPPGSRTIGSDRSRCQCDAGLYATTNDEHMRCAECPNGPKCDAQGLTVQTLVPRDGWWRASNESLSFYACLRAPDCVRGGCENNRVGPLCAVCRDGYRSDTTGSGCSPCPSRSASLGGSIGFTILLIAALLMVFAFMWRDPSRPVPKHDPWTEVKPFGPETRVPLSYAFNAKLLIGYLQVATALLSLVDIPWPSAFLTFVHYFDFINLDFVPWGSVECVATLSFYDKLVLYAVIPPVVLLLLAAVPSAILYVQQKRNFSDDPIEREVLKTERRKVIKLVVFALFLMYPTVSSRVLSFFACRTVEGTSYLSADFHLECHTDEWYRSLPLAIACVAVYPVGIPVALFVILRVNHHRLQLPTVKHAYGLIYEAYSPALYWFELADMSEKLFLTALLQFFSPSAQCPVGMGVCALFLVTVLLFGPFVRPIDDRLCEFIQIQLSLILLMGYTLQHTVDGLRPGSVEDVLGSVVLLVVLFALCVLFVYHGLVFVREFVANYRRKRNIATAEHLTDMNQLTGAGTGNGAGTGAAHGRDTSIHWSDTNSDQNGFGNGASVSPSGHRKHHSADTGRADASVTGTVVTADDDPYHYREYHRRQHHHQYDPAVDDGGGTPTTHARTAAAAAPETTTRNAAAPPPPLITTAPVVSSQRGSIIPPPPPLSPTAGAIPPPPPPPVVALPGAEASTPTARPPLQRPASVSLFAPAGAPAVVVSASPSPRPTSRPASPSMFGPPPGVTRAPSAVAAAVASARAPVTRSSAAASAAADGGSPPAPPSRVSVVAPPPVVPVFTPAAPAPLFRAASAAPADTPAAPVAAAEQMPSAGESTPPSPSGPLGADD